ncbi:hypothetical protein [Pyxidicoccus xibeiensis]|uniref:hypothetical protein n=1 Tax=Pyxidicoccus xibeiensis TaxID=2906759 RepID=UPI0020A81984|nr:hypothetical protein [Pyxidicoccus xibeiensis]MCP3143885.1 hypothetical protein [Pyxidicoccus xibeiensis]
MTDAARKQAPVQEVLEPRLQQQVEESWQRARGRWSQFLLLGEPRAAKEGCALAHIDLITRQVWFNARELRGRELLGSLEAVLAHEVGHHVRYPGSLSVSARLRMMEKTLLPLGDYSLINVFCDLLINEQLGADEALRAQLTAIYRAFQKDVQWKQDPAFLFYLSIYEELWRLEPGSLMGAGFTDFSKHFPEARADAQLVAQNLFHLGPNLYTQFLYFVSIASRYVQPPRLDLPESADPLSCCRGEPTPEDWADALTPGAREKEAVRRAVAEGWLDKENGERLVGEKSRERRIATLPGQGTANAEGVPEVMAAYYRLEAERYLLRPPDRLTLGEAVVPTTLDEWELGDALPSVDWLATLSLRGDRLGAVAPLKRERIADYEGLDVPLWQPRVEIYLDVSGSMPDPRTTLNAMTLAAQILCVGAVRAGGWVRAVLYSSETVAYWEWCRSEVEMSRFLMHYIGGGTEFPFRRLGDSVRDQRGRQPTRVVITDRDFDHNYASRKDNARIFAEAAAASAPLVLLLHQPVPEMVARYRGLGARVAEVVELEDFPKVAAALAHALFQEERHVAL